MIYKIITTKQAKQNLKEIVNYISEDNPYRAVIFSREVRGCIEERLSSFPLSTKLVTDTIRMLPYKRYVILYMVDEAKKLVKILNIFAGGQDWESLV